mgnify:CR=1 FL=1
MAGAVWYATGYLYSLYTAAEHSILALQQQGPACPWRLAAAADDKQIQRLSVVLQAVSRCRWFASCLWLSDMPLSTPTTYLPPQGTGAQNDVTISAAQASLFPKAFATKVVNKDGEQQTVDDIENVFEDAESDNEEENDEFEDVEKRYEDWN